MANYRSTYELMNALQGQVEKTVGDRVDQVVQFVGTLTQAVNYHMGQGAGTNLSTIVVVTPVADTAERITGGGLPLYLNGVYDLFIIKRANRGKYLDAIGSLFDIKDALIWDLFECDGKDQAVKDTIAAHALISSQPRILDDANLMAWSVQWQLKPMVT